MKVIIIGIIIKKKYVKVTVVDCKK